MTTRIEDVARAADRKAKKVAAFAAMLRDPDLADLVAALVDGRDPTPRQSGEAANGVKVAKPGVREAIRTLLDDDAHPFSEMQQFDRDNVKNFLDDLYARDAYSTKAVGDALHHLSKGSKRRILKIIQPGKGGKPNLYERV